MFLEAVATVGPSMISVPLATLGAEAGGLTATLEVGLPAAVLPKLGDWGVFRHKAAELLAKELFESARPPLTSRWMDCVGEFRHLYPDVASPSQRIGHHHVVADAVRALGNPDLGLVDLAKHLATDVVTQNGLPVCPEAVVRPIADAHGISATKVMPWVSFNLLEFGASVLAVRHAASNLTAVLAGTEGSAN